LVVDIFNISGYGVPAFIVSALFVGLFVFNYLITIHVKRYEKKKNNVMR